MKILVFQCLYEGEEKAKKLFNNLSPFWPFVGKSGPNFTDNLSFIVLPFLSYATEISASGQLKKHLRDRGQMGCWLELFFSVFSLKRKDPDLESINLKVGFSIFGQCHLFNL